MDIEKVKEILSNPNEWNKYTTNEIEKACEIGAKSIKALEKLILDISILSTTEDISDGITTYGIEEKSAAYFKESVLKIINEEFNKLLEEEDDKKE